MKYYAPTERIPPDGKHRWLLFADKPNRPVAEIARALDESGVEWWNIRQTEIQFKKGLIGYAAAIEAVVGDLTPKNIAKRLGVKRLLVSRETLPKTVELAADISEAASTDAPTPVRFGEYNEHLNPGKAYGAIASYSGQAPSFGAIRKMLNAARMDAIDPVMLADVATSGGNNIYLFLLTKGENPTVGEVQKAIGASFLNVNMYPADIAVITTGSEILKGNEELKKKIGEFGEATQDLAGAMIDLTKAAANIGTVAPYLLYGGVALGAGLLGFWGYHKIRVQTREWSEQ